jgi:hypothetical protein
MIMNSLSFFGAALSAAPKNLALDDETLRFAQGDIARREQIYIRR